MEAASSHPKAGSDLPTAHTELWPRKPSSLYQGLTGFPDFRLEVCSESRHGFGGLKPSGLERSCQAEVENHGGSASWRSTEDSLLLNVRAPPITLTHSLQRKGAML